MRRLEVDLGKEGLAGISLAPVFSHESFWGFPVPVGFCGPSYAWSDVGYICCEVARLCQSFRDEPGMLRQLVIVVAVAAVVVRAGESLVETNIEGASAGRADGRCRVRPVEANAVVGYAVYVGCFDNWMTVATELGAEVVTQDPENVGPLCRAEESRGQATHCEYVSSKHH